MSAGDPQSFNRYSYVGNNPLTHTDRIVGGTLMPIVVADLANYVQINGIKVPQTSAPQDGSTVSNKIQINVDYNEEIFLKPTTIEAGPETWRPKK